MDSFTDQPSEQCRIDKVRRPRRLMQDHSNMAKLLQPLTAAALCFATLLSSAWLIKGHLDNDYLVLSGFSAIILFLVYETLGTCRCGNSQALQCLFNLAKSWATVVCLVLLMLFATKSSADFSRKIILVWALTGFVTQALAFYGFRIAYVHLNRTGKGRINSMIVGSGPLAHYLIDRLNNNAWMPDHVQGIIEDDSIRANKWSHEDAPVLGNFDNIADVIEQQSIKRIYIAIQLEELGKLKDLQKRLSSLHVDIIWTPDIFSLDLMNHSVREVAGLPLFSLSESPAVHATNALFKNLVDKVVAGLALILLSPVMIATAAAVKLTSPGPVLFKQKRHGWDGRIIDVWKFRSMVVHQDGAIVKQACKDDDRITAVGRFIRRTSIDEIPQLFNVLSGSMSIVGPRPHAMSHNEYYQDQIESYISRHRIKPGMTGLAQIRGFRGETETLDKMQKRIEEDLNYIHNWSLWLDLKILFLTPLSLFTKNAY